MKSIVVHKLGKGLNRYPQFIPAVFAVYATGCQIGDRFNQTVKGSEFIASEIRLDGRNFSNQFAFSPVKYSRNANEGIIFGNKNLAVVLDFGSPNVQERHHWLFSGLPRVVGCFLGRVFPVLSFASGLQDVQAVADNQGREARKNQAGVFSVGHLWICLLSGALGWIAYGIVREWRLRREERTSLEKPYRIGGNTTVLVLGPIAPLGL